MSAFPCRSWLGLLLSLLLAVPFNASAREQLTIGITQFPATLHPNIDYMLAKTYVLGMVRRPLTAYDHDWTLTCLLCTELPTLENGGAVRETTPDGDDGIAVTYSIHPEARWGDGTPISSTDAVFTREVGRHPDSPISNRELYRRILSIDVVDDKTFTLHVDRVTFNYNAINDFDLLPAHLERPVFEAAPADYANRTLYQTDPTNPGLYFGPYLIDRVDRGSRIVLEANPQWWGEPPGFERIVIKTVANTPALEANLLSGGVDMIAGELGLPLDQALAFEQHYGERYRVGYHPGLIYEHLDVRLDNPILADRRVRQALLHGADREALSEQLFQGKQPVAHTSVNPLDWVYHADVPRYPHDPDRAIALLEEAGWTELRGGIRHNAAGERLSVTLMSTAGDRTRELVQQVLQSQWRQIGVDVRIQNQPPRVFFGETLDKREFDGLALFAWIAAPENVPRSTLHSEQIPNPDNNWTGQNYPGYRNPEVDSLIDELEIELDRERRRELWAELQTTYATDLPALPLYFRANAHIQPPWLEGVRLTGHMSPSTLWVEQWRASD